MQFGGILGFGVGSAGQLFYTNIAKKTNKSEYKCDIRGSILLRFAFNISGKVIENISEPKMRSIGPVLTR